MGKKSSTAIANILSNINATEDEIAFIDYAKATATKDTNYPLIIALFILSKQLRQSTEEAIDSNDKLVEVADKNSKRLLILTWVVALVGLIQVISMLIR